MRVLHVVSALEAEVGGSTAAGYHICGFLREAGIDAELAGTFAGEGAADYISAIWPDLPVHGFRRTVPAHYCRSRGLERWMRRSVSSFDVVAVHGVFKFPYLFGARAARRAGVPVVVHAHGSLDPYDLRKHRMLKRLYGPAAVRPMLADAALTIVTADLERDRLKTFGADPPVAVVPLPVPPPRVHGDGMCFRERYGIDEGAPLVLFLSRLDPKKGIGRILGAAVRLRGELPDLRVAFVGGAELPHFGDEIRAKATALGLDDVVVWTGPLLGQPKWDALAAADAYVLPSDNENFAIAVIEAALAGLPLVVSSEVYIAEALREVAEVSICGTDVASFTTTLHDVLLDPDAKARARAAVPAVRDRFSPDRATAAMIDLYDDIIKAR